MEDLDAGILRKQSRITSSSSISSARPTSEWGIPRMLGQGALTMIPSTFLPTLDQGKAATNSTSQTSHPQASNDVSKLQAELNLLR